MIDVEAALRRHFANSAPGADFDTRVLGRIAALRQLVGSRDTRAAAAAERYARERAELLVQRRESLLLLLGTAVLAAVIAVMMAPVTGAALPRIAALLGSQIVAGVSVGLVLTLLPLAVWLGVRQPRIASRW